MTGATVTKYYSTGSQRIAMRKNGTLYYLLGDHLGSTSIVTDASGTVISQTRYKAWGEVRHQSGVTPTEYGFTGQFSHAADFGLLFYNARWYDVSLGRFAQADSIVPPGAQGLDRYAYVNNSPMNYVDPSGHEPGACQDSALINGHYVCNPSLNDKVKEKYKDPLRGQDDITYREFGAYRGKWAFDPSKNIWHVGIDAGCTSCFGTNIYSVLPGEVVEIGWNNSGYGNYIIVKHEVDGVPLYSIYAHLGTTEENNGVLVEEGQIVDNNTPIGTLGNSTTGTRENACEINCMGAHLHFEVRYAQNINLAENESMLARKDYWAFDKTWRSNFFDLGSIYGYDTGNPTEYPLP